MMVMRIDDGDKIMMIVITVMIHDESNNDNYYDDYAIVAAEDGNKKDDIAFQLLSKDCSMNKVLYLDLQAGSSEVDLELSLATILHTC